MTELPFWKTKTLEEMDNREWESLCDGCGLCCLNKLEDWETGEGVFTSVRCRRMAGDSCRCTDYDNRQATVPACIQLTTEQVAESPRLPATCARRLVREGRDLYWWHHLVSGDPEPVHIAGISARGHETVCETEVDIEDFEDYAVDWPWRAGEKA